eukprot:scaffold5668_cov111-Isochrysis_galbana.AAC.16
MPGPVVRLGAQDGRPHGRKWDRAAPHEPAGERARPHHGQVQHLTAPLVDEVAEDAPRELLHKEVGLLVERA